MTALVPSSNYHSAPLHHHQVFTSDLGIIIIVFSWDSTVNLSSVEQGDIYQDVSITRLIRPRSSLWSPQCCGAVWCQHDGEKPRHDTNNTFKYQLIGRREGKL